MRYFTSDLHFGHTPILAFCERPFHDVYHMRHELVKNINAVVKPTDLLYILGDFSFWPKDNNVEIVKSINCPAVLIRGNHDHSNRIKNVGFADVHQELDLVFGKHLVTLSHYPFRGDHTPFERYLDRRPKDVGQWLLHGHTHSKKRINRAERMIHVGTDAWNYAPISELDILKLINEN